MRIRQQYQVLMVNIALDNVDGSQNVIVEERYDADGKQYYYYNAGEASWKPISENRTFRSPAFSKSVVLPEEMALAALEERKAKLTHYTIFLTFSNNYKDEQSKIPPLVWERGLLVDYIIPEHYDLEGNLIPAESKTVHFKRALRSSSQYRTAKMLMAPEDRVLEVRMHASYGWLASLTGKEVNVAKIEPYISMSQTSTLSAGTGWTFEAYEADGITKLKDFNAILPASGSVTADTRNHTGLKGSFRVENYGKLMGDSETESKIIYLPLTDGQAMGSSSAFAKIAYRLDAITRAEYDLIHDAFAEGMSYADQIVDPELDKVWSKIPRGVQFRFGLFKGFMVMMEHGYEQDFVFPEGTNKGDVTKPVGKFPGVKAEEIELCIAATAPMEEKTYGKLNYQFIQALNIKFPALKVLADDMENTIMKALQDPYSAMAFLGMVCNNDEDFEAHNDGIKIRQLISANIKFFYFPYIQKKIKTLMENALENMKTGRIFIEESRFAYVITDPMTQVKGKSTRLLKKGQAYFNGKIGEYALFRNPLIHKSEVGIVELVSSPELDEAFGHLKNILILNAYDDILPRGGGADTDGDKFFMTNHPLILQSVYRNEPMVYGSAYDALDTDPEQKAQATKVKLYKWEGNGEVQINEYEQNTLQRAQIGIVTNWGTAYVDVAHMAEQNGKSQDKIDFYWDCAVVVRDTQGNLIDAAKRGHTQSQILDGVTDIKVALMPHWLKDQSRHNFDETKCYHSTSPMGQLYDYVTEIVMKRFTETSSAIKSYSSNLFTDLQVSHLEVDRIRPQIQELEAHYRAEMFEFMQDERFYKVIGMSEDGRLQYAQKTAEDFGSKYEYDDAKQERRNAFDDMIARHQAVLGSIKASTLSIAACVLQVSEFAEERSRLKRNSYPYTVAIDYLIAMGKRIKGNGRLREVRDVNADLFTDTVRVEGRKVYSAAGKLMGRVNDVLPGLYDAHMHMRRVYIILPVEVEATPDIERSTEMNVAFTIKFGKRYNDEKITGIKAKDYPAVAMKNIAGKEIDIVEKNDVNGQWIVAFVDGKEIGNIGMENQVFMSQHMGKRVSVNKMIIGSGMLRVQATIVGAHQIAPITTSEPLYQGAECLRMSDAEINSLQESYYFDDQEAYGEMDYSYAEAENM